MLMAQKWSNKAGSAAPAAVPLLPTPPPYDETLLHICENISRSTYYIEHVLLFVDRHLVGHGSEGDHDQLGGLEVKPEGTHGTILES